MNQKLYDWSDIIISSTFLGLFFIINQKIRKYLFITNFLILKNLQKLESNQKVNKMEKEKSNLNE